MRIAICAAAALWALSAVAAPEPAGPDWSARLMRAQGAFLSAPSPERLCALLDTLALSAQAGERCGSDSLRRSLLLSWLARVPGGDWAPSTLLRLTEHADLLECDSLSGALRETLLRRWPESTECWEAMQAGCLAALYPVWSDDTARVAAMESFLEEWGERSDYWRSRALAVIVSSTRSMGDTALTASRAVRWVERCPECPEARLAAGRSLLEMGMPDSALFHLQLGVELMEGGWRPQAMPAPEAALTVPRIAHDLQWRRAQALAAGGDTASALSVLEPLLTPGLYPDSLHHTPYDYLVEAAELRAVLGDTARALELLVSAEVAGRTRYDSLATARSRLADLLGTGEVEAACREITGYEGPVFEDVTAAMLGDSGLPGKTRVAWGDYDRDGWPDLLLGRRLFRNCEGREFVDITMAAGLHLPRASGAVWGDVDGNGWPDLVTCGSETWVVLNRRGVFDVGTASWQPLDSRGPTEGVGLLDWNGDGRLDVYLARYERPDRMGLGTHDLFLMGTGAGFRQAGDSLGMTPPGCIPLCGRGVSPCDYDRDGRTDILVSDYRLDRNLLWRNRGTAVEAAMEAGVETDPVRGLYGHTIGSDWADWDNDGDWDLFCANLAHPRYIRFSRRSMLLRNDGGTYVDATPGSGIRYEETHSVPAWGDFDGDGLLDLYITSVYAGRRSFLYRNLGEGRFRDVTFLSGARVTDGWGAATADFDRDGRLDLAVGTADGPRLLRNVTPDAGRWLLVHVRPQRRPAVGCVLEVRQGDAVLLRQVEGGSGTTCQSSGILHLALPGEGDAEWSLYLPGDSLPAATGGIGRARREITVP